MGPTVIDVDELYLAHVVSTRAHARLIDIDASEALAMSGVIDFISHRDVPAKNNYVLLYVLDNDEETVFAKDIVSGLVTTFKLKYFYTRRIV